MSTLYELTDDYLKLLDFGQDPDIDEQTFNDTLEGLGGEIEDKAENYAKVIKQLQLDIDAIKNELDRLSNKKKSIENKVEHMKSVLTDAMQITGKTKFKTPLFSIYIQKNPPSAIIDSMDDVPEEYWRVKREIDKSKIKDEINAGAKFKWAHLEQSESVRIR